MSDNNNKSKNVKIPEELIDAIKKRAPDVPPGETLLAIFKEYEKIETLAKCTDNTDLSKTSVYDALFYFFVQSPYIIPP